MYFMKVLGLLLYVFVSLKSESSFGYHELVGIPRAIELLLSEGASRIVGGSQVGTHSSFPYQAGIIATLTTGWTSVCGGAVISKSRILTAAHCWWDGQSQAGTFTIILGSLKIFSGGKRINTADVVTHPSWNPNEIIHDVAMVKIPAVNFNNDVQSILLPTMAELNESFAGMTATASGYGQNSDAQNSFSAPKSLYSVQLTVITNSDCENSFNIAIHGSHMCTKGASDVETCDGDSGGPLTVIWRNHRILVGIVTFGLGDGCQEGYPSVCTRITAFLPWINANL